MADVTKRPATRYSPQTQHNKFGISNYLFNNGIKDLQEQQDIVDGFVIKMQFVNTKNLSGGKLSSAKTQFIQHRFSEFCKYFKDLQVK